MGLDELWLDEKGPNHLDDSLSPRVSPWVYTIHHQGSTLGLEDFSSPRVPPWVWKIFRYQGSPLGFPGFYHQKSSLEFRKFCHQGSPLQFVSFFVTKGSPLCFESVLCNSPPRFHLGFGWFFVTKGLPSGLEYVPFVTQIQQNKYLILSCSVLSIITHYSNLMTQSLPKDHPFTHFPMRTNSLSFYQMNSAICHQCFLMKCLF